MDNTMKNPFLCPVVNSKKPKQLFDFSHLDMKLTIDGVPVYKDVDDRGKVGLYRMEQGVPVLVKQLGNIKTLFEQAIHKAALMTPEEMGEVDFTVLTNMEAAGMHLAKRAGMGDLDAIEAFMDRAIGKPKIVTENKNLNLTIDDILTGAFDTETGEEVETTLPPVPEGEE